MLETVDCERKRNKQESMRCKVLKAMSSLPMLISYVGIAKLMTMNMKAAPT